MHPNIALGMKLRRLFHAEHLGDLRQYLAKQPGCIEQLKGSPRAAFCKHPRQLVPHPLAADLIDLPRKRANRLRSALLTRKPKPRRKPNRPQHPQLVFFEAENWIADRPHEASS